MQYITILGATGSIGVSTLDVLARHPEQYSVYALSAHSKGLDGAPYSIIGFGNGENRTQASRAAMASLDETVTSANNYHQDR